MVPIINIRQCVYSLQWNCQRIQQFVHCVQVFIWSALCTLGGIWTTGMVLAFCVGGFLVALIGSLPLAFAGSFCGWLGGNVLLACHAGSWRGSRRCCGRLGLKSCTQCWRRIFASEHCLDGCLGTQLDKHRSHLNENVYRRTRRMKGISRRDLPCGSLV